MDSISPAWLLLAVFLCSMIGRFMLIRAAWEISKPWGIAVLFVPFAPMVFRMKYKELASEGQHWRTATMVLGLAFIGITGGSGSIDQLWDIVPEKWRPEEMQPHHYAQMEEQERPMAAAEPGEVDGQTAEPALDPATAVANPAAVLMHKSFLSKVRNLFGHKEVGAAAPAPGAAQEKTLAAPTKPTNLAERITFMDRLAKASDPRIAVKNEAGSPAASPAIATLTPPLIVPPTLSQRVAANQAEFARLANEYEALKKEKGYLKKWDQEQIKAYNESAAKYQAALAAARAEQTELMKQAAVAKK
jgi:hypothetical protein